VVGEHGQRPCAGRRRRRAEEPDKERFFAEDFDSAAACYAALLRLTEHNAAGLGRTRMFNVLAAEAGNPGHPAHAYFRRRYGELREVMSGTLRRAVEGGGLKPGTDVVAVVEETAAVMDGFQVRWVLDPRGSGMVDRFRAYADRLLRSVTTDGTGLPPAPPTGTTSPSAG
jgi:hypothetical protein